MEDTEVPDEQIVALVTGVAMLFNWLCDPQPLKTLVEEQSKLYTSGIFALLEKPE